MDMQLGAVEARFADIIWAYAPMTSAELVRRAQEALGWKKSTTYTVLKRLCDKGLFQNDGGTVSIRITREQYCTRQSRRFVEDTFQGSLPAFLAAFTGGKKLTEQEIAQLRTMIAEHEEK
jgi:predicted transcriptional regulator